MKPIENQDTETADAIEDKELPAKLTTNEDAEPSANKDAEPSANEDTEPSANEGTEQIANEDAKPLANQDIEPTSTSTDNVDAPHHEDDSPKNEDATGCLCKTKSSLVSHMGGWCLVSCNSSCVDTTSAGVRIFAGLCKSVQACHCTKYYYSPLSAVLYGCEIAKLSFNW